MGSTRSRRQLTGETGARARKDVARASCFRVATLVAALVATTPAFAQEEAAVAPASPHPRLVVPIEQGSGSALARGWGASQRRFVAQRGTCVDYRSTEFDAAESLHVALEVLSRAGGHLRLGLHVAVHHGIESLAQARLSDAARRLARQDEASFRAFCGEAFVAGVVAGAHFVGEFEIDGRQGNAAHAWLRVRRLLGPSDDLEALGKTLEHFAEEFSASAQALPDGLRGQAKPMSAEALIAAAVGFPASPEASLARPYLALLFDYPARMRSGLSVDFVLSSPASPGRAVFAAMRPRRSAAAEMRLARPQRRPPPRPVANAPVFRVERYPVRVFRVGEMSVYAGQNAPPDHFSEGGADIAYWVPGAAAGTPRVRAAIARAMTLRAAASERAPLHWVRRYASGDIGGAAVYFSPDAPLEGIHRGRNPAGFAWIPGVSAPSPREQKLLDDVLSTVKAQVSSPP